MAQRSMFFDAVSGDRSYDAASLAALLRALVQRDGVVYGYGGTLAVSATDPASMNVTVATGAAFVQGRMFEVHTSGEQLAIGTADPVNPRIDRIVVKLDNSSAARKVSLAVKAGTPAASPTPPTLQRDSMVWELSLAQVRVNPGATSIASTNITDERGDPILCGATFGFLAGTSGHPHTGAEGAGPKLTHDAIDTAKISAFSAYQSTAQSIAAATWTKVAFQTEVYDHLAEYNPATYTFIPSKSGVYIVYAGAGVASAADGTLGALRAFVNNTEAANLGNASTGVAGPLKVAGSAIMKLNAGDSVDIRVYLSSAYTLDPYPNSTCFAVTRIA